MCFVNHILCIHIHAPYFAGMGLSQEEEDEVILESEKEAARRAWKRPWKGREASQNPPIHPVKRSRATVGPAHVEQISMERRVCFCSALDLLVGWVLLVFPHLLYNLPYNIYWILLIYVFIHLFTCIYIVCVCWCVCLCLFFCLYYYMYIYIYIYISVCVCVCVCILIGFFGGIHSWSHETWGTHYILESECLYPSRFVSRCSPDTAGTDGLGTTCERCAATGSWFHESGVFDVFEARNADFTHSDYRWL